MHLIVNRSEPHWRAPSTDPHPIFVEQAVSQLVTALHNYHAITSGQSEEFVSYAWELPRQEQEFLRQRVGIAERAIWKGQA